MQRTPPVLHRTLPDGGGKSRGKIARIPETNFSPDFGYAAVRQRQQRLRLRDAGADEVVVRRRTHIAAEETQEVAAAHVRLTQQIIQRQRLIVLLADGLRRLLDHLLIALRLLLIQQPLRAQRQQLMQRQRHLQHTIHRAALQLGENRLELFFHFLVC